jgi:hypothetical protein
MRVLPSFFAGMQEKRTARVAQKPLSLTLTQPLDSQRIETRTGAG